MLLLASRLGDDLLGNAGRDLGIRIELHAVVRPALGPAPQIPHVTEHLRQRDESLDHPDPGTFLHGLDVTAAAVEVADDLAHVVVGRPDLDGHDRLEQNRARLARRLLDRHRAGDLEGELGRVDLMVGAVGQRHFAFDHRVAGQHSELRGLLAAGVHRRDVLPRDPPAGHLVLELVPSAVAAGGLEVDEHPAVLAGAAGLLLVGVLDLLDLAGDRLAVGDLRPADVRLDLELAAHPVDQHLQVQFAHSGDDRLAGLLVGPDLEGRVLLGEPLDRGAQLLLVTLGLRLDGHVDHRRREGHRLEHDRLVLRGQRVAGGGVLQAHHRDDLAGHRERALLALVRVHLVDLADPLAAALDGVQHGAAGLHGARVDADVGELAEVLVRHDLEGQRRERRLGVGIPLDHGVLVAHGVTLDGGDVDRAGQVVHDRVEHGLDALVLERGPAQHRVQRTGDGGPPDGGDELLLGGLGALQVQLHHLVDEADPRYAVPVGLPPDGLGLGLYAGHGVEDRDRAVEHAQRALHLDGEVHVTGSIDDVDGVAEPARRGSGRGDGNAAFLLLLHPVHGGRALMDLTDLVVDAGVEQDALGGRSFARVDMRHDPDVADLGEVYGGRGGHFGSSFS